MELLLSEILNLNVFKDAEIIAGKTGMKNKISFATVMDVPGIVNWLHGGEMLLAAGLFDECSNKEFFLSLKQKSVSAVITKPAYVHKLDGSLKALCDELQIPVITVPSEVSWGEIMNPITELVAKMQYDVIYQSQQFHAALMNSLMQGESLNQLCDEVYKVTKLTVALTDSDFQIKGFSSNIDWTQITSNLVLQNCQYCSCLGSNVDGVSIPGYTYNNFFLGGIGHQLYIFPVVQSHVVYGYILLLAELGLNALDVSNSMRINQLSLLMGLEFVKELELNNAMRRYNNLLLDRILHEAPLSEQDRYEIENSIECTFYDKYYFILAKNFAASTHNIYQQEVKISKFLSKIRGDKIDFRDVLCFERGNDLVVLAPEGNDIRLLVEKLLNEFQKMSGKGEPLYFGCSDLMSSDKLSEAYKQALQAVQYTISSNQGTFCFYKDLGVLRFFMDKRGNIDYAFLSTVKSRYIDPLHEYDMKNNTQLEETLSIYLNNNRSNTAAEAELYIHKNTLRARLLKIEKILQCDLHNSEDLFNIQLASKIKYCFDYYETSRLE